MKKKFIKQIRRIEIKRWIETLRALVKIENEGFETTEDIEAYLDSDQAITTGNNIVAVRVKIKKLFKARNDFSVFKQIKRNEIREAIEDYREYQRKCKEVSKEAAEQGYPTLSSYDYALVAETSAAYNKISRLFKARNDFRYIGA